MRIYPVILCGGSGTRLWPASRPGRPKQFMPLVSDLSLFRDTVGRLRGLEGGQAPTVVAGERHAAAIAAQLAESGVDGTTIVEPEGRDSAPAIAAAVAWIAARDPEGVIVVMPSDHHIPDDAAFRDAVSTAARAAAGGAVVTFGVKPTGPATAYGYLEPGPATGVEGVFALDRFVEKPDAATAAGYVAAGFLWNSGYFVFQASVFLAELARHAPGVAAVAAAAVAEATQAGPVLRLGPSFRTAPKISIDYAVMEKTDRAAVAPVDFDWSDLGAWDSVWAASPRNGDGNSLRGDALMVASRDCLVRNDGGPLVVGVGLQRIAIVAEADAILVCGLDAAQEVKAAVDALRAAGRPEPDIAAPPSLAALAGELSTWLTASALPVWWALGADQANGGFHEALGLDGRPVALPKRARVQARQIYSYAVAGALGWPGPWRQAVEHGLDFFLRRYLRPDGLFRTLVEADGAVADDTSMLYDQAFALLALASAAQALPDRAGALAEEAGRLLARLREPPWSDGHGFVEASGPSRYQSNPQMHLFEAALAWGEAGGGPAWNALADQIAELALGRLIDGRTGAMREFYAPDWTPAPGPEGRIVEPGHQFEWAWLLARWGRLRGRADAGDAARRLFAIGTLGVDARAGLAVNAMLDDFSVHDAGARLWPQTERLKAALILGDDAAAVAAGRGLQQYFQGVAAGYWLDKRRPDGGFTVEPATASSFYHIVCALAELRAAPN